MNRFDESFYLEQANEVRVRARDQFLGSALLDYVWVGTHERRSPSPAFDEAYYLASNPDVAAALRSAQFVCGYHHYLKNGEAEGRRAVPPGRCCVVVLGPAKPANALAIARLVSAIQYSRPRWRIVVAAGWRLPAGLALHPWVWWIEHPSKAGDLGARIAAEHPAFVVSIGAPAVASPEGVAMVAVADRDAAADRAECELADAVVRAAVDVTLDDHATGIVAERIAAALETVEQVKGGRRGSRLVGGDPEGVVGYGLSVDVPAGDALRVVVLAVDLSPGLGRAAEQLVLEAHGETVALEVEVGRPAHTVVRLGPDPARIAVRPRKAGYRAVSRVALARIESAPLDLVIAPVEAGGASDALAVIDLNTDLSRMKRELGRFMIKADALMSERPAFEFGLPALPRLKPVSVPKCLVVSSLDADRSWVDRDTLDVAAWRDYLENRGFVLDFLELPPETAGDAGRLRKRELGDHRFVVVTGPRSPEMLSEGLDRAPHVVRLYRGATSGGRRVAPNRRSADLACARLADRLIVASADDAAIYRAAGVRPGRIDYVPEFLPAAYRQLVRPYAGRPRQAVVHVDTVAVLDGRILRHGAVKQMIPALVRDGWRVIISVSSRLRPRVEADLELDAVLPLLGWCDPAVDLPSVLHATRVVLVPGLDRSEIGGLATAAQIVGFRILLDAQGQLSGDPHFGQFPRSAAGFAARESSGQVPVPRNMEEVRAEAFRSLDRVLGFRDAGWQEGRGDRSPDI